MYKYISRVLACAAALCALGLAQAQTLPNKTFYQSAGWLDHRSNTLRRVAQRGEAGAAAFYQNPNPSPKNQYEAAHVHAVNLQDLRIYQSSTVYRQARQIRDVFLTEASVTETETAAPVDLPLLRAALSELLALHRQYGDYYPIVTQAVLEVTPRLLPLQKELKLFTPPQLTQLRQSYLQILSHPTQCAQGDGYRLFCEGRADALDGFAQLASSRADAQRIADVLVQDLQQPLIGRELLSGLAALLSLKEERLFEPVLQRAIDREGDSFWQKINVFMVGYWIDKVQFSRGRYLGNVSAQAVLPGAFGPADGNSWEEAARMLAQAAPRSAAAEILLRRYGLGSCQADETDLARGVPTSADGKLYFTSVQCRTLLPFLVGALGSGVRDGAAEPLAQAAQRVHLTPAAYVARIYFSYVLGDVNAETEKRVADVLYDVFSLQAAQAGLNLPRYERAGVRYQRKQLGQKTYQAVRQIGQVADFGLGLYYTAGLAHLAVRAGTSAWSWGVQVRRGLEAVRAGQVTAEVRQLAALSARLKKLKQFQTSSALRQVSQRLKQSLAGVPNAAAAPLKPAPAAQPAVAPKKVVHNHLDTAVDQLEQTLQLRQQGGNWQAHLRAQPPSERLPEAIARAEKKMDALREQLSFQNHPFDEVAASPENMQQYFKTLAQYIRLEQKVPQAQQLYNMYLEAAGKPAQTFAEVVPSRSFASHGSRDWLFSRYWSGLQQTLKKAPNAAARTQTQRQMAQAVEWSDLFFGLPEETQWGAYQLPSAAALRARWIQLGKGKKDFTPLQMQEYKALQKQLYASPVLGKPQLLELQNRLVFFPQAQKTPNAVFLAGDDLLVSEMWNRKTPLGFFRPTMLRTQSTQEALKYFKAGEENVLLAHVHGGLSHSGRWKGILVDGSPHPELTLTARELLSELPATGSTHNSIYINGCFSGTLIDEVQALKASFPAAAKTDWFVTAAPRQFTAPESLPADFVSGTARERLFGKILTRMRYNGDALGARVWVDNRLIYPLQESVQKLAREIKKAPAAQKAQYRQLQEDLQLLQEVADARSREALLKALLKLDEQRPGSVLYLEDWSEDLLRELVLPPSQRNGPDGFYWAVNMEKTGRTLSMPTVVLKPEWVEYVAKTAEELFGRVPKIPPAP